MKNPTMTLGDEYTAEEKTMLGDVMTDTTDDIIGIDNQTIPEADAIAWRKAITRSGLTRSRPGVRRVTREAGRRHPRDDGEQHVPRRHDG